MIKLSDDVTEVRARGVRVFCIVFACMLAVSMTPTASAADSTLLVTGIVTDANGNPLSGALVTLYDDQLTDIYQTYTNENGAFIISTVSLTDRCKVTVSYRQGAIEYRTLLNNVSWYDNASGPISISPGDTKLDLTAYGYIWGYVQSDPSSQSTISGKIYAINAGNPGSVYTAEADKDSGGQYLLHVPAGSYIVYAMSDHKGKAYESERKQVSVPAVPYPTDVNPTILIVPYDYFKVTGTVIDAENSPVNGARVLLYDGNSKLAGETSTDYNGEFRFYAPRPKAGTCKVIVSLADNGTEYKTGWNQVRWYHVQDHVTILSEDIKLYDYPPSKTGYIWGYITSPDNFRYFRDGKVYLDNGMTCDVTDDNRAYQFNVPVGIYRVYAVHYNGSEKYVSETVTVHVNGTRSILDVTPTLLSVNPDNGVSAPAFIAALTTGLAGIIVAVVVVRRVL